MIAGMNIQEIEEMLDEWVMSNFIESIEPVRWRCPYCGEPSMGWKDKDSAGKMTWEGTCGHCNKHYRVKA